MAVLPPAKSDIMYNVRTRDKLFSYATFLFLLNTGESQ